MRPIPSVLASLVTLSMLALTSSGASAGRLADCRKPPPAWYTAPRVTHTYSVSYGAGYSHDYSAQRRSHLRARHSGWNSRR